jgi:hypothetical protein
MPKLSLYRSEKSNDYRFFDRTISEMFSVGATDLYVHKYLGVPDSGPTASLSQPRYDSLDPRNIQDLLFLENRDRKYDDSIYRLRGHYNVQNLDFDLSQFGLFLNNDVIFVTVHYNDMINIIGRKLMVGDVFEMPHLTDYHPLNEAIPTSLRRYYQITDSNFASEGFSNTWYPHLWRIKCEPLVDSQEFSNILKEPVSKDNYLGDWNATSTYVPGYVVSFGDKNYIPKQNVPAGVAPPNSTYWELDTADNLKDILGRYNKNIAVNDAMIAEAARIVPKLGYDRSQLYLVPTANSAPALPVNVVVPKTNPVPTRGNISLLRSMPVLRIGAAAMKDIWDMPIGSRELLKALTQVNLEVAIIEPERTDTGSGPVEPELIIAATATALIDRPYGTSDNIYTGADEDITLPDWPMNGGPLLDTNEMDFRADADPRFRWIVRYSPESFGYTDGNMTGDGTAPNGLPFRSGITFPSNPQLGDYFLRIDYLPNIMYRYDGNLWVKISVNNRPVGGFNSEGGSQLNTFINNTNVTTLTDGTTIPEIQSLSQLFKLQTD